MPAKTLLVATVVGCAMWVAAIWAIHALGRALGIWA